MQSADTVPRKQELTAGLFFRKVICLDCLLQLTMDMWLLYTMTASWSLFIVDLTILIFEWPVCQSQLHTVWKSIPQTNKHILSHCAYLLDRYSERHNRIMKKIVRWIDSQKSPKQLLAVDLPFSSFIQIDTVFKPSIRPDIVLYNESSISILELTVCHETNFLKSKDYKLNKYKEAQIHLQYWFKHIPVRVYTAEISVLGIVSDLSGFFNAAHLLSRDAIKYSFEIYKQRNTVTVQS